MLPFSRRFLREYLPGKGKFYFWGILFLVLTVVATTTIPGFIGRGIDIVQNSDVIGNASDADRLYYVGWQIIGLGLLLCVFRVLSRIYIFIPGRRVEAEIRQDYFNDAISIPTRYLSNYSTGDLVSRGTNDIGLIRVLLSMGVLHTFNSVLLAGFCLFNMFQISTTLTVVCLLTLPLAVLVIKFLAAIMMHRARIVQRQLGKLTETIRGLLRAHTLLSIYPVFDSLFRRFSDDNHAYRDRSENVQNLRIMVTNFAAAVASLSTFILMVVGGPLVINGAFGIAEFVEYSIYLGLIQEPMRIWGFLISIFQRGEVCLERIYDIRDLADDVKQRERTKEVSTVPALLAHTDNEALVSIRDLRFHYDTAAAANDEDSTAVADEFSQPFELRIDTLDILRGRKYGIFGQTGSGKTTLLNLLTGNLPTPPDTCRFQGIDYGQISTDVLLKQFAIATQDNRHFDGSIGHNLDLIRENSDGTMEEAFHATAFDDAFEISQLANDLTLFKAGLNTVIGEHGIRLSGGQRQRLAILRALLKPRQLLVLDDIISAVDHETESRILAALYSRLPDETLIIISHRISALIPCGQILIMADGCIVDRGPHDELLSRHEGYRQTYEHQVVEQQLLELEK